MKQRLLAIAALLGSLVASTVAYVNWNDGTRAGAEQLTGGFGMLEVLDRSKCTVAACNATACQQAQNVLDDAGAGCTVGFVDCSVRLGASARAIAADAGVSLPSTTYQRLRLIGMRCAVDGGFAYAVPVDDAGWPVFAVATGTPQCVRAPVDGGGICNRVLPDAGLRYFGAGNVFPVSEGVGPDCQSVECAVFAGDDPNTSL